MSMRGKQDRKQRWQGSEKENSNMNLSSLAVMGKRTFVFEVACENPEDYITVLLHSPIWEPLSFHLNWDVRQPIELAT